MKQATNTKVIIGGMPAEAELLPHTRVQLKYDAKQNGTVMPYMRECSQGLLGFFQYGWITPYGGSARPVT
jgi:hypothetical protein